MPIDLAELADDAAGSLAATAAAAGVSLQLIAGRAVHVMASPKSITRVIRKLIDNARSATVRRARRSQSR